MGGTQYRANYLPGLRELVKRESTYLTTWTTEGRGGVFSQLKSDIAFRSTLGGMKRSIRENMMDSKLSFY